MTEPARGKPPNNQPARGYKWAPFQPGHTLSTRHGATSERRIAAQMEAMSPQLAEEITDVSYLSDPSFGAALRGWLRAEARCELVRAYLDEHGLLDRDGMPRPAAELMLRLESQASKLRSRLGLDPVSRAQLQRDLTESGRNTVSMAEALAEGRRLRLAAQARMAGEDTA